MNKELRQKVYNKYNGRCGYCGKRIEYKRMQVDHIEPQYKKVDPLYFGVTIDIDCFENLMPSCSRCNHYKRAFNLENFRELIKTIHERIQKQYINKVALDYGIIAVNPFNGQFFFETKLADSLNCETCNALGWTCSIHE